MRKSVLSEGLLLNLLLLAAALCGSLLLGEVAVRWLAPQNVGIWSTTRDGITIHPPHGKAYLTKFDQTVRMNSMGMRDREHSIEKQPGALRILVLGDSFMEAFQVSQDRSFARLLEANLRAAGIADAEVINASVSGWGTDDQVTYLMRYGIQYKPDLILVGMTLHNDVSDNLREEFHILENGKLRARPIREMPFWRYKELELKSFVSTNSHLYQLWIRFWRSPAHQAAGEQLDRHVAALIRTDGGPEIEKGWAMTRGLFKRMREIGAGTGAKTSVFLIPLMIQLSDERLALFLEEMSLHRAEIMPDRPQRIMKAIGREEGIEVIDLLPSFRSWKSRHSGELHLEGDGHWNAQGHALAAAVVARELLGREVLGSGKSRPAASWISRKAAELG